MAGSLRVDIENNVSEVRDDWGKIRGKIPEVERENSKRIAEFFAESIRRTIRSKLMWKGKMLDSVRVRPKHSGFGDYSVTVNAPIPGRGGDYAAWHEFASKGHFVKVKEENYPINRWAESKGIPEGTLLKVEPTPFMNESVRQAGKRMRNYLARGGELNDFLSTELGLR